MVAVKVSDLLTAVTNPLRFLFVAIPFLDFIVELKRSLQVCRIGCVEKIDC